MKSKLLIPLLITCSLCTNTNVSAKGFHGGHSSHSHSHTSGRSSHSTHTSRPSISKPSSGTKARFKSSTSKSIRNSTNKSNISKSNKSSTKLDNNKKTNNDTPKTPKANNTNVKNKTNNKSSNVINKQPINNNINNNINSQPSKKHSFFNSGWLWFLLGRSTSHRQPVQQTQHLQNGKVNENNIIQQDTEKQYNHRKILRNLLGGGAISIVAIITLRKLFNRKR